MRHVLSVLSLCLFISWSGPTAASVEAGHSARHVIWKLDDLRGGSVNGVGAGFNRVAEWCHGRRMKVSMGIVGNSLEKPTPAYIAWIKANAIENGGLIEFWNHGWDHGRKPGGQADSEFKGTEPAFQRDHLTKANRFMQEATGITFHTFGSPFNASDAVTIQEMGQIPEFKVWLYGPKTVGMDAGRMMVLGRSLNLEAETGKVSAERFLEAYAKSHAQPYLVLQGHPGGWDDGSFRDFTTIADRLSADGWIFVTPYEYFQLNGHAGIVK